MNKIKEQIDRFTKIKQKIPTTDVTLLSKGKNLDSISLLSYFLNKNKNSSSGNQRNNMFISNSNLTENTLNQKPAEKHKFILQKHDEKGKSKTQQGKNHGNNSEQGQNGKGNNKNMENPINQMTLLDIENQNIRPNLKKIFEKNNKSKEEEEKINKDKKVNKEKEAGKEETNQEKEKEKEKEKENEQEKEKQKEKDDREEFSLEDDDNDKFNARQDIEKVEKNDLNMAPEKSTINILKNFTIFDKSKMDEEEYDNDSSNDNNDYIEDRNKDTWDKKDDLVEEKKNNSEEKEEKKEKEEEKNKTPEKENKGNTIICIPLEEEKEKNNIINNDDTNSKQNSSSKKTKKITNKNNNHPNKLLQNKTKRTNSVEEKKSTKNKNNTNIKDQNINSEKLDNTSKNNKKIITDSEDEELTKTSKKKNNNNIPKNIEKKKEEEPIIKSFGTKFTFCFDTSDIGSNKKDGVEKEKEKDTSNKKIIQKNDLNTNKEKEAANKNKNSKNAINKNISQINSQKGNNILHNYDLSCLDNIYSILNQIEEKLNNDDKSVKADIKKCYDSIDIIKKDEKYTNNLLLRKKHTYTNLIKILRLLFLNLGEKNPPKLFNNEIVAIFTHVEKYYKLIKKNENSIDKDDYYHKRKIAFKYAFSKLELKNYEQQNIKALYTYNNKDDDDNNNVSIPNNKNAVKFIKTYKRYIKTSSIMYKEVRLFNEKLNNLKKTTLVKEMMDKYENCGANIQMSPNLMNYKRLFSHFYLIFSFYMDSNRVSKEFDEQKRKENGNINDFRKKGKSMQINKNGIHEKRDASVNSVRLKNNK